MGGTMREITGVAVAIIFLAGVAVVVARGSDVASILSAGGESFAKVINAATLRG